MAQPVGTKRAAITIVRKHSHVEEFVKCSRSIFYFIWKYIKIIHPQRGLVDFKMFPFQLAVVRAILLNRFCITLKPRQMGMTTLVCAYALWLAIFFPYKKILIISIKDTVSKAMLRKIKNMYRHLPDFLQMEIVNGTRTDIGTATMIMFSNGSEIEVRPATEDAGRSEAVTTLILDEVAFQRNADAIWGSAAPTLSTGGQAILLSTAFGFGNFFHNTWVEALQNLNGFFPIKLHWRMHPERNEEWYKTERSRMGEKRTAQEIDCDFLKSGYNVFDMAKIRAIEDRVLQMNPVLTAHDGNLRVYHEYDPTKTFVLSADIASGRSRDYSAFSIFDHSGKEYVCYKGKIGVRAFAHLLMEWGYKYNAILAPEINAIGEGIMSVLQENNYPYIYNSVSNVLRLEEFERQESLIQGWLTTGKSRHEIITQMDDDLSDDLVEINNPFFVQEAYTFIYNEQNKPIALGKELGKSKNKTQSMYEDESSTKMVYSDDSILAACIGNYVRQNPAKFRGNLPMSAGS